MNRRGRHGSAGLPEVSGAGTRSVPAVMDGRADLRGLGQTPIAATGAFADLRRTARVGLIASAVVLGAAATFLSQTVIAGAVVASGTLVVDTGPKQIQHPKGGIVAKLLVNEDDPVKAGQPLVIVDQTVDQAKLVSTTTSLVQQQLRLVRLKGERDSLGSLDFPLYDPTLAISRADYNGMVEDERRQFELGVTARDGQKSQLRQRIAQTEQQVAGDSSQLDSTQAQITVVQKELDGLRGLFAKQLVGYDRLSEMERTLSQLTGTASSLRASIAAGGGKIDELNLQIDQVDQDLRSQLTDQLAQTQSAISELSEQLVVARDDLAHDIVVAPLDGVVHQLEIHTAGGVIQAGETLMVIVPQHDQLVGEVKLSPRDIDQLYPGQDVSVHFTAFDRGTTPEVDATLASISPDLVQDSRTGAMYYTGRIETTPEELAKLHEDSLKLVPGMPLEAFIKTSDRTVLSYLVKPLTDQMDRAFR